jgi:hypothetical protein
MALAGRDYPAGCCSAGIRFRVVATDARGPGRPEVVGTPAVRSKPAEQPEQPARNSRHKKAFLGEVMSGLFLSFPRLPAELGTNGTRAPTTDLAAAQVG